jgi:hypothetical protein
MIRQQNKTGRSSTVEEARERVQVGIAAGAGWDSAAAQAVEFLVGGAQRSLLWLGGRALAGAHLKFRLFVQKQATVRAFVLWVVGGGL